jgi:hypothetical protein
VLGLLQKQPSTNPSKRNTTSQQWLVPAELDILW